MKLNYILEILNIINIGFSIFYLHYINVRIIQKKLKKYILALYNLTHYRDLGDRIGKIYLNIRMSLTSLEIRNNIENVLYYMYRKCDENKK